MSHVKISEASIEAFRSSNFYMQMTNGRDLYPCAHSHSFYEINSVISGTCCQRLNEQQVQMVPGTVVFLRPGDSHRLHSQAKGTNLFSLSVKATCADRFLHAYGQPVADLLLRPPAVPYLVHDPQAASYIADAYRTLLCTDPGEKDLYCTGILNKVIQSFSFQAKPRSAFNQALPDSEKRLRDALEQMNDPQYIAEGLPALERLTGYSRPQLCRLFRQYLHTTPYAYLHDLRMNFAGTLVSHTSLSVAEIAERVGFLSASHFTAAFKGYFGKTPLQLRKEH